MKSVSNINRDVIIGLVVTDRLASLDRLLASLRPVDSDENVHVCVLDNGRQPSGIRSLIDRVDTRAAGRRSCIANNEIRAPLHRTRVGLSHRISELIRKWSISDPIVWMVDDDVTFDRLQMVDGKLVRRNVARQRIDEVRSLGARDRCDLLVSGFTGDAPVRPNSVISRQLSDLTAELSRLDGTDPTEVYEQACLEPAQYQGDYYYSHSPKCVTQWREPYPWLVRPQAGPTVADQVARILQEARGIEYGRGVFRPLIEQKPSDSLKVKDSQTPNRGGNAVFFGVDSLLAHPYPSFRVGEGYSRRSDMIGSSILARNSDYRVAEGNLSLCHDRRDQNPITEHPREWRREFVGVLFARIVMRGIPSGLSAREHLIRLGEARAQRIHEDAKVVCIKAESALTVLERKTAWWWRDQECCPRAHALKASLTRIRRTFEKAHRQRTFDALVTPKLLGKVLSAYRTLQETWSVP